ncbi:SDR family NAD(P)-dependent oxidoreductase [Halalkalibacter oceani]|uniref:SDR family NAD(P)-dependent oxidoreductase n=1 Tax=Halalkalibacter oceani TaxID=1653776 RepID=A0A9X2DTL2_9BACI|nr:SDR family NAD(P)-dependent oxidoreductase [Halalkalibacter oceani]MCM3716163.1 SDR family NAD(P)-dependent oxidoreductase [Halalkalibacter oceani]
MNINVIETLLFPEPYVNEKKLKRELNGKTVLITGASSGIGEQTAYLLAEMCTHLILVARRKEKLIEMQDALQQRSAKVSVYAADLRKEEEMSGLLHYLHQLPDGLDIVVSNAGKSIRRSIEDSLERYHDFTRTMAINYFAPVRLLLSVIPLLEKNQGHIIHMSTINVLFIPVPDWAAYQASKTAFDTWFRSAEPELKAMGINTTSFYLPLVRTPMILPTPQYEKMPAMAPEHVARLIARAIYTKQKRFRPWWITVGEPIASILRPLIESLFRARLAKRRGTR